MQQSIMSLSTGWQKNTLYYIRIVLYYYILHFRSSTLISPIKRSFYVSPSFWCQSPPPLSKCEQLGVLRVYIRRGRCQRPTISAREPECFTTSTAPSRERCPPSAPFAFFTQHFSPWWGVSLTKTWKTPCWRNWDLVRFRKSTRGIWRTWWFQRTSRTNILQCCNCTTQGNAALFRV